MAHNQGALETPAAELSYRLYTIREIAIASYLGGPVAGCYLMSVNYRHLQQTQQAQRIFWLGLLGTLALFTGILFVPPALMARIPNYLIPFVYTIGLTFYAQKHQGKAVEAHLKAGGQAYSGWKVAGLSLGFLALILIYVLVLLLPEELLAV